jgi:hypothetical protein
MARDEQKGENNTIGYYWRKFGIFLSYLWRKFLDLFVALMTVLTLGHIKLFNYKITRTFSFAISVIQNYINLYIIEGDHNITGFKLEYKEKD